MDDNGEPKAWFHGQRDVQTRSFIPFLVVDVLSRLVSRAMVRRLINGTKVGSEGVVVSHLQFADDIILFVDNDKDYFSNVLFLLQIFELSWLKINWSKSCLAGANIDSQTIPSFGSLVGCQIFKLPFVYLGVPLGDNPRTISF